jgi:RNA polymerase sigma factor (sigma-70 family)
MSGVSRMTKLPSPAFLRDFRALFSGGTLAGIGEGELLDRFVNRRDEAAFEELIARHGPMVLSVCRRWLCDPHDVEDAFQATFLILVRKAGSLRDRDSVCPWLHGVSHRVARRARATAARRRDRASQDIARRRAVIEGSPDPPAPDDLAVREVMAIVDEEILRLPESQQAAVDLCLVQGMTHEAASRALGWPLGTVKSRLATARATLARRLARRGLAPSALVALARSDPGFVPATVMPPDLAGRTLGAAVDWVGNAAEGVGSVAILVREVSRMMFLARLKLMTLGLIALGALAWAAPALLIARPDPPRAVVEENASPTKPEAPRRDLYGDALPTGAHMRLGTVRYRQDSPIYRIAYSSDGKYVVTDSDSDTLQVWNAGDGRLIRRIDAGVGKVADFALGSDPNTVMVGSRTG